MTRHDFVSGLIETTLKWRMPSAGQLMKTLHINHKKPTTPILVDLTTNLCIPFTLPLALQTRQFTKRQLRSQEVNAKRCTFKSIHAKIKPWNKVPGIPHAALTSKEVVNSHNSQCPQPICPFYWISTMCSFLTAGYSGMALFNLFVPFVFSKQYE